VKSGILGNEVREASSHAGSHSSKDKIMVHLVYQVDKVVILCFLQKNKCFHEKDKRQMKEL
jgi:hypothetical protein